MAFSMCCISIEACMREIVEPGEVANIVAENTDEMREHAEWAYAMLERPYDTWEYPHGAYLPLERLAETPQFVDKNRSSILQIADSIAFVINRHLTLEDESGLAHCWDKLAPQIRIPKEVVAFSADPT
jgi:hypothetical protein